MVTALMLVMLWLGGILLLSTLHFHYAWFFIWSAVCLAAVALQFLLRLRAKKLSLERTRIAQRCRGMATLNNTDSAIGYSNCLLAASPSSSLRVVPLPVHPRVESTSHTTSLIETPSVRLVESEREQSDEMRPTEDWTDLPSALPVETPIGPQALPLRPRPAPSSNAMPQPQPQPVLVPAPVNLYGAENYPSRNRTAPVAPVESSNLPNTPSTPIGPVQVAIEPKELTRETRQRERLVKSPRSVLRPADYQRNAGVPGFLYLARNPEHWAGMFKVGQTCKHPNSRVQQLNREHEEHSDIGTFELLDMVPVSDAYGAEQALFKVLEELRPVRGREFFIAHPEFLSDVMRAISRFVKGEDEWINRVYQELDPQQHPRWPAHPTRHHYYGVSRPPGWVYLARNRFHQADTYRFGAVKHRRPEQAVEAWNKGQREATSQIGFYDVVYAVPVWDTAQSRTLGWRSLRRWRMAGTRSFVRGPLSDLANALSSALK